MKILLVDDDAFLRDMYATKFGEYPEFTIDVADNAENAIAALQEKKYDLVMTDMVMPGMSGVELIAKITQEKIGGGPDCIMLSNQGEDFDKRAADEAGAIGYIVKAEFIPTEVVEQVRKIISEHKK